MVSINRFGRKRLQITVAPRVPAAPVEAVPEPVLDPKSGYYEITVGKFGRTGTQGFYFYDKETQQMKPLLEGPITTETKHP